MAYPEDIDTFREIENLPGLVFDPDDKRTLFMEDLQAVRDSVVAIENFIGVEDDIADSPLYGIIGNLLYPVGKILALSTDYDPNVSLGFGTWEVFAEGRTLVGIDTGDTDFDTLGETRGEKTHILSVGEIPAHAHAQSSGAAILNYYTSGGGAILAAGSNVRVGTNGGTANAGGGGAHNNIQPSIVVAYWVRVS